MCACARLCVVCRIFCCSDGREEARQEVGGKAGSPPLVHSLLRLVWFVSAVPRGLAYVLRGMQRGALQGYALTMAVGLAILAVFVLW